MRGAHRVCWSSPRALEKTRPSIALPAGGRIVSSSRSTRRRAPWPNGAGSARGSQCFCARRAGRARRSRRPWYVHFREIHDARHLHIVGHLHKMRARDHTIWDDARAVPGLRAPRDLYALRAPDPRVRAGLREPEDAPVLDRGHCGWGVSDDEEEALLRSGEAARRTVDVLAHRVLVAPAATHH